MFDVGFWEVLLIGILALVIIGPQRLPAAARQAGYFFGKARRYIEGVKSEVASELDISEFKRILHNQETQISDLQKQLKSGFDDVKSDMPSSDFLTESPSQNKAKITSTANNNKNESKQSTDVASSSASLKEDN